MSKKRLFLLVFGLLLCLLSVADVFAAGRGISYNDSRFASAVDAVMAYLEGSFGAMIMAAAGIATVICAAFGQYRLALSLLVVAIGAFVLRSLVSTFFNDASLDGGSNATVAVVRMADGNGEPAQDLPAAEVYEQGNGVEIYTDAGVKVRSFEDGTVTSVDELSDRGTSVTVKHLGARSSTYSHLGKAEVRKGQAVKAGDEIGVVGSSGLSKESKPRLYFEMKDGKKSQPIRAIYPSVVVGEDGLIQDSAFLTDRLLGEGASPGAEALPSVQMERF